MKSLKFWRASNAFEHSESDNIEIIISDDEADKVIKKPFDSLKNRYQNNLELMEDMDVVFVCVYLFYYKIN